MFVLRDERGIWITKKETVEELVHYVRTNYARATHPKRFVVSQEVNRGEIVYTPPQAPTGAVIYYPEAQRPGTAL